MKQFKLFICTLLLFQVVFADQPVNVTVMPQTVTPTPQPPQQKPDTAPIVVGALLQKILPNLIHAAAANDKDDLPSALNHCATALKEWGALFSYLSRNAKKYPTRSLEKHLDTYMTTAEGQNFVGISTQSIVI